MAFKTTIIQGKTTHGVDELMSPYNDFLDGTSGIIGTNDLVVTQNSPLGMSVLVEDGVIVHYISSATTYYRHELTDATTALTIDANSSGSTRIDLICVKTDLTVTPDTNGVGSVSLVVVKGTAGAGVPSTPANHVKLAEVTVANGAANITNANISDTRTFTNLNSRLMTTLASATQTLTNKRITKRVNSVTSSATPTPNADTDDVYLLLALAEAATFGAPTGTPTHGQPLIIRIKDNGTARTLAFNAVYRFSSDLAAPTTTIINKTMYLGFIYNFTDTKWDCVAKLDNF